MKYLFLMSFTFLGIKTPFTQSFNATYQTEYPTTSTIVIQDIEKCDGDGYIASFEYIDFGIYWAAGLMRLADNGDIIWSKTFALEVDRSERAYEVIQNDAGNFYFFSFFEETTEGTEFARLCEVTDDGELLWIKDYPLGISPDLQINRTINDMELLESGEVLLQIGSPSDLIILKVDESGTIIEGEKTERFLQGIDHSGLPVLPLTTGEYVYGYKQIEAGFNLFRKGEDGTIIWSKAYSVGAFPYVKSLYELPDGNFLLGGYSGDDDEITFILKINSATGEVIWGKQIEGYIQYERSRLHFSSYNDNILIDLSGFFSDYRMIEMTVDGEFVQASKIIDDYIIFEYGQFETLSADKKFTLGAYRIPPSNYYGFIECTPSIFETSCYLEDTTYSISVYDSYSVADYTPVFETYTEEIELSSALFDLELTTGIICEASGLTETTVTEEIQVYPNPAQQTLTIALNNEMLDAEYNLADLSGKILLDGKINALKTEIDLTQLKSGIYQITIQKNETLITEKISVIH